MYDQDQAKSKILAAAVTVIIFTIFIVPFVYKKDKTSQNNQDNLVNLENYSPVIDLKNDDDVLIKQILDAQTSKLIQVDPNKDNLTDAAGRDLFTVAQYARTNKDVSATTLGSSLAESVTSAVSAKQTSSFNLISNPKIEDYKTYGNTLAALHINILSSKGKEIFYMGDYETNGNKTSLEEIKKIENRVGTGCALYKQVQIPTDLYELHKNLIFLCDQYDIILQSMLDPELDPVKTLAGLKKYPEVQNNIIKNVSAFTDVFKNKNIIFKPSDLGYFYTNFKNN